MKPLFVVLTALLLTGCAPASVTIVQNERPPAALEQTAPLEEKIRYTVETRVWQDQVLAEDGTVLVNYDFSLPVMTPIREDGAVVAEPRTQAQTRALETAGVFNDRFQEWAQDEEIEALRSWAAEDLSWRREEGMEWTPYYLELECALYQTDRLVSVSGEYYSSTGGVHPNTMQLGWNFDLETGSFLGAELLTDSTEDREAITEEMLRQARRRGAEELFWEDYEAIIADWPSYAVSFDQVGMSVVFSPYELAAYAAGPQAFSLPYSWLAPHLSERMVDVLGLTPAKAAK